MIVGFVGVVGSGKDHRAKELVKQGFVQVDFKDALLDMASDLVGYDVRQNYDYFKENLVGLTTPSEVGPKWMQRPPAHTLTKDVLACYPHAMTGRLLLQRLGTEVMRKRNPDYWCKAWREKVVALLKAGVKGIAVADVRFANEMSWINSTAHLHNFGYHIIFCDYHSARYNPGMDHESERMSQAFLKAGKKDGDIVAYRIMEDK